MIKGKMGKRSPSNKSALRFGDHISVIPQVPIADVIPTMSFPMDQNDVWGDCVVAGADHTLQAICTQLWGSYTNWTEEQILAYYKTQNPDFDPNTDANDNGMDIQTFLEYLVKEKVILAFAKVDYTDESEMKAAIYLGLGIMIGQELTKAQETQEVWDYVPGQGDIGGHCTSWVQYLGAPDYIGLVSWGELLECTQMYINKQVDEAWFVLTQAHVDSPAFRAGFNLESFASAYTAITGDPFPVDVTPPSPTPTPVTPPVPTPVPEPTPTPTPTPIPTPVPVPPDPTPVTPPPVPNPDEVLWQYLKREWKAIKAWAEANGLE